MASAYDYFRLNPEPDQSLCPPCKGEGIIGKRTCDFCNGGCYVPSEKAGIYNQQLKSIK